MRKIYNWLTLSGLLALLSVCTHREEAPAPEPEAAFTCAGPFGVRDSTAFVNASVHADSYRWDFGDGTTSRKAAPKHAYQQQGQYTVRLEASGPGGTKHFATEVTINAKPRPGFVVVGPTLLSDSVRFENRTSGAVSYRWSFGDGSTSTRVSPAHRYQQAGQYTVTLEATGAGGTEAHSASISVNGPPQVAFVVVGQPGVSDSVRFENRTIGATAYLWSFGDGSTSTRVSPAHRYPQAGQYLVLLSATGPGGTEAYMTSITVSALPVVAFNIYGSAVGDSVRFDNQTTGATTYRWEFGDGSTSTRFSPKHRYSQAGQYSVRLQATGPGGTAQYVRTALVLGPPVGYVCDCKVKEYNYPHYNWRLLPPQVLTVGVGLSANEITFAGIRYENASSNPNANPKYYRSIPYAASTNGSLTFDQLTDSIIVGHHSGGIGSNYQIKYHCKRRP